MTIAGSKVCVVGGAGFLGSHLTRQLVGLDCTVAVIDDLSVGKIDFIPKEVMLEQVDITDSQAPLEDIFSAYDYVFNYVSIPYIPDCFKRPVDVVNVSTLGALRVLEAAHKAGVKRILQVSSAEVYGNYTSLASGLLETDPLDPCSTYAVSKAAIDQLCQCRFKEAGVPVIILRQFNCVGERETHPYVIPEIIDQVQKALELTDGSITVDLGANTERDFLYAGDATRMAIELSEKGKLGETYNLGSERSILIYDLATTIGNLMRPDCKLSVFYDHKRMRPAEIWSLKSENAKIYNCITSRPTVSLEDALKKTIAYYEGEGCDWGWVL